MNTKHIVNTSLTDSLGRRDFLKVGAALTLAIYLPGCTPDDSATGAAGANVAPFAPNAFVRIGADNKVVVISKHIEMGQGTYTGLATLVAEELDADWSQITVEGAPADTAKYTNLAFGLQGTGGSTAIANSYEQYRQAGAAARSMLVSAAAARWKVGANDITVSGGKVTHAGSNRSAAFGELVADASQLAVPTDIKLKEAKDFVYIGKPVARVDAHAKSTGTAMYTQDFKLPDMLTAVVAHPPRFGSKVKSFDATKAKEVKGVVNVVSFETPVTTGVAVIATDFWSAKKGRDALTVEWDETNAFKQGSPEILADYRKLAATPGPVARNDGDVEAAFKTAARVIEATYEVPFLAHASMEPLNCVAQVGDNSCEIWNGEQFQTLDQAAVAKLLGIPPENVKLNMLFAGGSFGRRANPLADYVMESAAIAKASGSKAPIKMVWTREDDTQGGFYRPLYVHSLKAGLDKDGNIIAWRQRIVGQSIMGGGPMAAMVGKDGIDPTSVEGASTLPYTIPNLRVELHTTNIGVPIQWWRSVGSSHTGYVTECFLDELARAGGKNPFELRRSLLSKHPRHLAVLELAAAKADWNTPLAAGRARGIAVHESFGTVVAQVAEVTKTGQSFKLDRVICAVDCGVAVNPNIIAMQMESGIGYGLSAALNGAITLKDGIVEQTNFHQYPVLRMNQAPPIEVHIVPSTEKPTGVGEPGTPVIAPALINALMVLTGKPVRALPLSTQGIQMA